MTYNTYVCRYIRTYPMLGSPLGVYMRGLLALCYVECHNTKVFTGKCLVSGEHTLFQCCGEC